MTRALCAIALVASLVATAGADRRGVPEEAAAAYAEGQELFVAKRYDDAAAQFKQAWAIDPDPAYLFNIAQALRFAKRCSEAATYYRKFLDEVTSAPNLDEVHGYLAEVEECAKVQTPAPPPPAEASTKLERAESAGSGKLGLVVGGIGIVLTGVGATFLYNARSLTEDHDRLISACTTASPCEGPSTITRTNDLKTRIELRNQLATGFMIAGGVALATGIVLHIRGRHAGAPPVAIAPTSSGAIVTTTLSF